MAEKQEILAGWLIDGTGAAARRNVLLSIRDGVIDGIEPFDGMMRDSIVDFSWAVLVPPFVDSHLHLAMSGSVDEELRKKQLEAGCEELYPVIAQHIHDLYSHGVLTVRDGGDRDGCVRRFIRRENDLPISIATPGPAWHLKGRYGKLIGRALTQDENLAEACAAEEKYEYIKIVNSGLNSLEEFGKTTAQQFSRREIAELADRLNKRIMVHANGVEGVREAVMGGCHSIEHGFFMGMDNMERMAEKGIVWVPTAVTMKQYAQVLADAGDVAGADVAKRNLEHQLEQIQTAHKLGVSIALGTDSGSSGVLHGQSVVEEMKLLIQAGLSLEEAIQSATSTGMGLLDMQQSGTLEPGQPADFLVARGTRAQLPRKFTYLEAIYRDGRPDPRYRKNPEKHVLSNSS